MKAQANLIISVQSCWWLVQTPLTMALFARCSRTSSTYTLLLQPRKGNGGLQYMLKYLSIYYSLVMYSVKDKTYIHVLPVKNFISV